MRYLGLVRKKLKDPSLRALLLMELIGRVCKNTLREMLRRSAHSASISSEGEERNDTRLRDLQIFVKFYNLLFSSPPVRKKKAIIPPNEVTRAEVKDWWMKKLKEALKTRYPEALTKEEMKRKFDFRHHPLFQLRWLWDRLDCVCAVLLLLPSHLTSSVYFKDLWSEVAQQDTTAR